MNEIFFLFLLLFLLGVVKKAEVSERNWTFKFSYHESRSDDEALARLEKNERRHYTDTGRTSCSSAACLLMYFVPVCV